MRVKMVALAVAIVSVMAVGLAACTNDDFGAPGTNEIFAATTSSRVPTTPVPATTVAATPALPTTSAGPTLAIVSAVKAYTEAIAYRDEALTQIEPDRTIGDPRAWCDEATHAYDDLTRKQLVKKVHSTVSDPLTGDLNVALLQFEEANTQLYFFYRDCHKLATAGQAENYLASQHLADLQADAAAKEAALRKVLGLPVS